MNNSSMAWYNFYAPRVGHSYYAYAIEKYKPFLKEVEYYLNSRPGLLLVREEGAGIATFSRYLLDAYQGVYFHLVDNDERLFPLMRNNLDMKRRDDTYRIHFENRDIRTLSLNKDGAVQKADLIIGHGVLEHLEDEDILKVIDNQKRSLSSNGVIVQYVPLDGHVYPSFGDERLLPLGHWLELTQPTDYVVFNEGKDLVMVWDNLELNRVQTPPKKRGRPRKELS